MKTFFIKILCCVLIVMSFSLFLSACSNEPLSAYDIAVKNGFVGNEQEWLASLKGKSDYEIAVENGFEGTEQQWLISLKGGKTAYEIAVENGFEGTEQEWLASLSKTMEDDIVCASEKCLNQVVEVYIGSTPASAVVYQIDRNSGSAYFITCYHVAFSSSGTIQTNLTARINNANVPLEVVGGLASYDIAILKIENSNVIKSCNLSPVKFASSISLAETCIAIGNSKGLGLTCTTGVIGQLSSLQEFTVAGTNQHISVLIHSASTTTGNSGGGLFNTKGELIGITNGGKTTDGKDVYFIKFAVSVDSVKLVVDDTL